MKERLRLVKAFSELRAGMIVVAKYCQNCHRDARGIISGPSEQAGIGKHGNIISEMAFLLLPGCCNPAGMLFAEVSVKAEKLFRVLDGLEDTTTQTTKKRKVRA